jgi:helix-turn-helix protein
MRTIVPPVSPRRKKRYVVSAEPVPAPPAPIAQDPLPYSFDLKAAARYTGFSPWALRKAITAGELRVVSPKPYLIRRADLEQWVDQRVQTVPPRTR